jgi:predicted PurR-regulated permease PerM
MDFRQLPRWLLWSLFLPLMVLNGWVALKVFEYFRSFFTIAIAAILLAFILDYPLKWLQRSRLPRAGAVGVIVLIVLVGIGTLGLTLFPLLFDQVAQLSERLPDWIASSTKNLAGLQSWATQRGIPIDISALIARLETYLSVQAQSLSGLVLTLLPDAVANVLDIFLTLVLTIYLLLHGEEVWHSLFRWLPVTTGRRVKLAIAHSFHNYFVSQAAVALMMSLAMTVAFLVIQVPFGLLFGLAVGGLAIVPFGAALGIVIVSCLTAFQSVWLGLRVLIVAIIVEQVIENAIAPTLIGGFIGLNPVWILISLLIGAKVLGLLGLILAVPVASTLKALLLADTP